MYTHASSHINSQTQDPYNWFSVVVADFVLLHGAVEPIQKSYLKVAETEIVKTEMKEAKIEGCKNWKLPKL